MRLALFRAVAAYISTSAILASASEEEEDSGFFCDEDDDDNDDLPVLERADDVVDRDDAIVDLAPTPRAPLFARAERGEDRRPSPLREDCDRDATRSPGPSHPPGDERRCDFTRSSNLSDPWDDISLWGQDMIAQGVK
mmetsp:Transcript_8979/g.21847  ORF Transcript_8979/g.21847 Transcript_8979/m.21847 type:complete len:138 (-) Transcript_8979:42-455(-)